MLVGMAYHSVLCPVDFSTASRGALRYGAVVASQLRVPLQVLTVADPLLSEAAALSASASDLPTVIDKELHHFAERCLEGLIRPDSVQFEVATGKPAVEILRVAKKLPTTVIVMSTHGLTGFRKLFFGSTTERVLRETTVPVLLTPAHDPGPATLDDVKRAVKRVLLPVDLTPATQAQVDAATAIAETLAVPVLLAHVVEPVRHAVHGFPNLPNIDGERRSRAERALTELGDRIPGTLRPEALVAYGDPAEEIAKIARDRDAGLIVIGLHASALLGPRMGSVTYRVLCLTHTLVLALPPRAEPKA